ncbi:MAG: putative metalloprotease CJM1_0395 family protein [Gammaproteobacteria bacterium]
MHVNSASHTVYYGQQTDRAATFPTQQLIERPIEKTGTAQAESDRNSNTPANNQQQAKSVNSTSIALTEDEQKQVEELKLRDREVRTHEAAHKSAAGSLAKGGAQFSYQTGPDGHRYAVGGEVNIDTSKEQDPAATIRKAQQIRRAANAPAEPSSQDRAVAAQAAKMEAEARQELNENNAEAEGTNKAFSQIINNMQRPERTPGKLLNVST